MSIEFYWIAVVATTIISASRLTRLATVDKFPPIKWVREKYADVTDGTDWFWLMYCGYCFSFWATLTVIAWGWFAGVYPGINTSTAEVWTQVWWTVNGTLAAAYLAAVFMANDGDDGDANDGDDGDED